MLPRVVAGDGGGLGSEVAPRLTFQDTDKRVKINPQAPVAGLASLASQLLSLSDNDRQELLQVFTLYLKTRPLGQD